MTDTTVTAVRDILGMPPVPAKRSTFIEPRETLLNGMPWATIETETNLSTIRSWVDQGMELGILTPATGVNDQDDTVFLIVSTAHGERVVNLNPNDL